MMIGVGLGITRVGGLPPSYAARWGLVSLWKLDEVSGARVDSYGANPLTDVNSVSQGAAIYTGLGNSAQFTAASSQQLTAADSASLSLGNFDFWYSCFVYLDTVAADHGVLFKGSGTAATTLEFSLRFITATSRFKIDLGDSTGVGSVPLSLTNSGAIGATTPYHVFVYHDSVNDVIGGVINNGTPTTVTTGGKFPNDTSGLFRLGMFNSATSPHDGRIDEVAFGKSPPGGIAALLTEIPSRIYNSGSVRAYPWLG